MCGVTEWATRRGFLRGLVGTSAAGVGLAVAGIPAAGAEGRSGSEPTGTVVFMSLVGGVDGLSVLVPYGDPAYGDRRPGLAIGPPLIDQG